MKRKWIALCLTVLLVLCFAVSCNDNEPVDTEPIETEPEVTEPAATEPAATEPAATEPAATEPAGTEPAATEPAATEPAATEPAGTEPEGTEPEGTEPEGTDPVQPEAKKYVYDLKKFTVVRPAGYSAAMDDAVGELYDALVGAGVDEPAVSDDKLLAASTSRKEILLGSTNRPETATAEALLKADEQYVIAFYENKIVVAVKMEQALPDAIEALAEYLSEAEKGILSVEADKTVVEEAGFKAVNLFTGSEIHYNIVVPAKLTKSDETILAALLERFETCTGEFPEIVYEGERAYREGTKSIIIGNVDYPEVAYALSGLERNEYAVRAVGSKVVIAGHFAMLREEACNMLLREMAQAMDNENKTMTLCIDESWQGSEDRYLLDFPEFTYGVEKVSIDNENKTLMLGYSNVKSAQYTEYCQALAADGYTLWQENTIAGNLFKTYRKGEKEICLNYYPKLSSGTVQLFADGHVETAPIPEAETSYTKVSEAILHVMSLDYTHRTVLDGHGMNYVITLEDGRYIVMDGGYASSSGSKDAQRIYEYLVEHNQRKDGKVVIAAWFMSHPHGDHCGAFESFVAKYKKDVTIEYFIANPYSPEMTDGTSWFLTTLPKLLVQTNTALIKPHAGQIITFCNTELEVIYTHENLYPTKITDSNNCSTIIRMKQNGHTVLFTGDASVPACNMIVKLYGDALESDMFQVNHHGCSGGTWELYDIATREDSYVLWTCSKETFFYRTLGYYVDGKTVAANSILKPNRDLALKVGFEKCFYADGVVEQITFPKDGEIQISEARDYAQDPTTLKDETEMGVVNTANILPKSLYLFEGDSFALNYGAGPQVVLSVSTDCAEIRDGKVYALKEGHAVISMGEEALCSLKILPTTMPELLVSTGGVKITSKEDYVSCDVTLLNTNEDYTVEYKTAGIRLRGNSTAGQAKKPYRIKFDSKINLLGMNDGAKCKSWVLLAEWFDDSLIRNTTALSLADSILEEYSSDWRYVRLILNGEDKGVYVLAEQSQINEYRVDIEEAGADTDELRSGYFFEVEGSKVDNGKFYISYEGLGITTFLGNPYNVQSTDVQEDGERRWGYFLELKNDDVSAEQIAFAEKYAQNIFTLIYSATYKNINYVMDENLDLIRRDDLTAEEVLSMAIDIDSMARMYIYLEMVCNFDAFKKSSYFYVDFSEGGTGKLTFACPWDHDRAFVKNWDAIEHVDVDKFFTAERSVLYVMMMNHEFFRSKVGDIWIEVYNNTQGFKNALDNIEKICDTYAEDFSEEGDLWDRKNDQKTWAMATRDWLKARIQWMNGQVMLMRQQ